MKIGIPTQLSDAELIAEVTRFAGCEHEATAQLVAHLAELDARRLYLGAGFSSLFAYCCEVLRLSERETYNRIEAARAGRRFPMVFDLLAEGAVNLTTVRLLAPQLTDDNHRELLAAASHHSKRDVEELIARRFPRPDIASSLRKLPAPKSAPAPPADPTCDTAPPVASTEGAPPPQPAVILLPPARRDVVAPLAPDRYEVRFTASAGTREKLRLAQDLLRHALPTGDIAAIVDRALTALLEELARKKFAAVKLPPRARGQSSTSPVSRHIPADAKRAVWLRDGGRCAFMAKAGRRCRERGFLEFHHVTPYGVGGEATARNIELRCRAHNAYEAELFYGPRYPAALEQ